MIKSMIKSLVATSDQHKEDRIPWYTRIIMKVQSMLAIALTFTALFVSVEAAPKAEVVDVAGDRYTTFWIMHNARTEERQDLPS